jgi:hypothetical protein
MVAQTHTALTRRLQAFSPLPFPSFDVLPAPAAVRPARH